MSCYNDTSYYLCCLEILYSKTLDEKYLIMINTFSPFKHTFHSDVFKDLLDRPNNTYENHIKRPYGDKTFELIDYDDFFKIPENPDEHNTLDTYDDLFPKK